MACIFDNAIFDPVIFDVCPVDKGGGSGRKKPRDGVLSSQELARRLREDKSRTEISRLLAERRAQQLKPDIRVSGQRPSQQVVAPVILQARALLEPAERPAAAKLIANDQVRAELEGLQAQLAKQISAQTDEEEAIELLLLAVD